jgi:hypothetical protein
MRLYSLIGLGSLLIFSACGGWEGEIDIDTEATEDAVKIGDSYLRITRAEDGPYGNRRKARGEAQFFCGSHSPVCYDKYKLKVCLKYRTIGSSWYNSTCSSSSWYPTFYSKLNPLTKTVSKLCTPADGLEFQVEAFAYHDSNSSYPLLTTSSSDWFRCTSGY